MALGHSLTGARESWRPAVVTQGIAASSTREPCPPCTAWEVDRDTVVLRLTLTRQAEGARPSPAQQLCQVFTIDGTQLVDIRGYPYRHTALTRP